MKSVDRQEIFYGVQYIVKLLKEAGGFNPYLVRQLKEAVKELPQGKQYKAYYQRIKKVVEEVIDGKIGLYTAVTKMQVIERELA